LKLNDYEANTKTKITLSTMCHHATLKRQEQKFNTVSTTLTLVLRGKFSHEPSNNGIDWTAEKNAGFG